MEKKVLLELESYIERHLEKSSFVLQESLSYPSLNKCLDSIEENRSCESISSGELEDYINHTRKATFSQVLFGFIDKKEVIDSVIYKKAGIDRRHFSKIRSNPDYKPGKNTTIALALALELNKEQALELLQAAGYSLSESDTFDLVIQFCLEKKIYNLQDVNEALDYFSQKLLSGVAE